MNFLPPSVLHLEMIFCRIKEPYRYHYPKKIYTMNNLSPNHLGTKIFHEEIVSGTNV